MFTQTAIKAGQKIHTRLLFEFDTILAAKVQPGYLKEEHAQWAAKDIQVVDKQAFVIKKVHALFDKYLSINGLYCFANTQQVLVKRAGYWQWKACSKLRTEDILYLKTGEVEIKTIEWVNKRVTVPLLITDPYSACFINQALVYTGGLDVN